MQSTLIGMMIIVIALGITSAVFFKVLPLPNSRTERITANYFAMSFLLSALAFVSFIFVNHIPRLTSGVLNSCLYLISMYCLRHGFIVRKYPNTPHLYKSLQLYLNLIFITITAVVFITWYDSQLIRSLIISTNIALILLSATTYIAKNNGSMSKGERIARYSLYLCCLLLLILPSSVLLVGSRESYAMSVIIAQSLQIHLCLGTLCALMLSDVVNLHYKNATTDSMTGLHNRRYFMNTVQERLSQMGTLENDHTSNRHTLIICDLDNFKKINDNYGHDMGDNVIRYFANKLQQFVTDDNVIARIGGEEFALFYPNTDLTRAKYIAESLRNVIIAHPFSSEHTGHKNISFDVTASFGVTALESDDISHYLNTADHAMYQAKRSGRNQVCLYEPA